MRLGPKVNKILAVSFPHFLVDAAELKQKGLDQEPSVAVADLLPTGEIFHNGKTYTSLSTLGQNVRLKMRNEGGDKGNVVGCKGNGWLDVFYCPDGTRGKRMSEVREAKAPKGAAMAQGGAGGCGCGQGSEHAGGSGAGSKGAKAVKAEKANGGRMAGRISNNSLGSSDLIDPEALALATGEDFDRDLQLALEKEDASQRKKKRRKAGQGGFTAADAQGILFGESGSDDSAAAEGSAKRSKHSGGGGGGSSSSSRTGKGSGRVTGPGSRRRSWAPPRSSRRGWRTRCGRCRAALACGARPAI
jgi:hypothetical protein